MKKCKLKKEHPNVPIGTIGVNVGDLGNSGLSCFFNFPYHSGSMYIDIPIEKINEWIEQPYCTVDGVEVFIGDSVYVVIDKTHKMLGESIVHSKGAILKSAVLSPYLINDEYVTIFNDYGRAMLYANTLFKFKNGDIVVFRHDRAIKAGLNTSTWGQDMILKVSSISDDDLVFTDEDFRVYVPIVGGAANREDLFDLANPDEILAYYEIRGWKKGAKFKINQLGDTEIIDQILIGNSGDIRVYYNTINSVHIDLCTLMPENTAEELLSTLIKESGYLYRKDEIIQVANANDRFVFRTKKQLQSARAFAKLTFLTEKIIQKETYEARNKSNSVEELFDNFCSESRFTIIRKGSDLTPIETTLYSPFIFKTRQGAELSLTKHRKLWEMYYQMD